MSFQPTPLWIRSPFVRLLIPLITGIILQWELRFTFGVLARALACTLMIITIYSGFVISGKYRFRSINGIFIHFLLMIVGAAVVREHDVRSVNDWFGKITDTDQVWQVTIQEPLQEKANSYKAIADIDQVKEQGQWRPVSGKIILYFKKDSMPEEVQYGSKVVFRHPLTEIRNTGNPGAFDYKQYCLFQGITHQAYLAGKDFILLPQRDINPFQQFIFTIRARITGIIKQYVSGAQEQGLAEALLIGYKDELDKDLVQAYTNTGVVHVIAISGLHLGLIYGLLLIVTRPLRRRKDLLFVRLVVILCGLWLFSFLAGAQPSVLRSAVMFSVIALAEPLSRQTSIYNTICLSAFVLLCINPFWLWDAGFLLSYSAIISIILFFRPIYHLIDFTNKLIDAVWKLCAVTIAAQILTLPVSVYFFHQLPLLFLLTNIVAVPLSSLIVLAEIGLCALSFIKPAANIAGAGTKFMISFMNTYIQRLNTVPFATWRNLYINLPQALLLTASILLFYRWFLQKQKAYFYLALSGMLVFIGLRTLSFIRADRQKQMIVYNIPHHQMIDLINGRSCTYIGDPDICNEYSRDYQFHVQPSRVLHRIIPDQTKALISKDFIFYGQRIFLIDSTVQFTPSSIKPIIDLVVLSKNPKLYMDNLNDAFTVRQIVIDASVPLWKARLWKRDCDSLHIPCWDVAEKGAYIKSIK